VANAVIFQNVVDQSRILAQLLAEGFSVYREDVMALRPYLTAHLKRFGDYVVDLTLLPPPLSDVELSFQL
jgi:Tn3 transposase DDE domain